MTQIQDESLYLMYAIELPEKYKNTNINEVVKNVSSSYELSMYDFSDKILITLRDSVKVVAMKIAA